MLSKSKVEKIYFVQYERKTTIGRNITQIAASVTLLDLYFSSSEDHARCWIKVARKRVR